MSEPLISRGFVGKRRSAPDLAKRLPPGQYLTNEFPVLSAGPTPNIDLAKWTFTIAGLVREPVSWTWEQFMRLPSQDFVVDISCVTKWTHLDMKWHGVSVDTLLQHAELERKAAFVLAYSYGGYTTNLPLADFFNGQAFIAYRYDDKPLAPEHGGPARLVVPHLYFWKSAKWIQGLRFLENEERGFWEQAGYNNHGDPWKEERYSTW